MDNFLSFVDNEKSVDRVSTGVVYIWIHLVVWGLLGDSFDYKALILSSPWSFSRREFGWLKWLLWWPKVVRLQPDRRRSATLDFSDELTLQLNVAPGMRFSERRKIEDA